MRNNSINSKCCSVSDGGCRNGFQSWKNAVDELQAIQIFREFYEYGFTVSELAENYGITTKAVRTVIKHAKLLLKM